MLKNVLGAYLNSVKERDFDLPFISLLHATGFFDIHFTHGQVEFGKDFIAKKVEAGVTIQFSFQSKVGDINQAEWRNNIMGQMLDSVLSSLSHPNFDVQIPHQTVLVITGHLMGNSALSLQDLNNQIRATYLKRTIELWDREYIITLLERYGLDSIHQATASEFINYGNFYELYGKGMQGQLTVREVEKHSRQWLDESLDSNRRLLCSSLEVNIFNNLLREKGMLYECIFVYLTNLRTIMYQINLEQDQLRLNQLHELYIQVLDKLRNICTNYINDIQTIWVNANKNLVSATHSTADMITYAVNCTRTVEIAGFLYFLQNERA